MVPREIYFVTKGVKLCKCQSSIGEKWRKMAEIGQKSKNVVFTTGNEWKNQHGIKFPCCFYRGLFSEFFKNILSNFTLKI